MNERVYDRVANLFILVAVASALLFNVNGPWHWVVVAGGVGAAIGAVVLYFTSVFRSYGKRKPVEFGEQKRVEEQKQIDVQQQPLTIEDTWIAGVRTRALANSTENAVYGSLRIASKAPFYAFHHGSDLARAYLLESYLASALNVEQKLSPDEIAACAIRIINELSSGEDRDRWEFSFGPNGLRIVAAGKPEKEQDLTPQSETEFGQISTMIN